MGTPPTDYKALICVFLNGGNDSNNMIIPTIPAEWENYAAIRGPVLAIPNADGGPATALAMNSRNGQTGYPADDYHDYGFHPAMPEIEEPFRCGSRGTGFQRGHSEFPAQQGPVQREKRAAPAAVVLPQRPADPVADIAAGPALHQRLGRPHRRSVHRLQLQSGRRHLHGRHARRIEHLRSQQQQPRPAIRHHHLRRGAAQQCDRHPENRAGFHPDVQQGLRKPADQGLRGNPRAFHRPGQLAFHGLGDQCQRTVAGEFQQFRHHAERRLDLRTPAS